MTVRQGYLAATWERRLFYVAHSGIIQTYRDPDDPATEGQLKWARKLGIEITDYMAGGRLGIPNISMSEMNHLIYTKFGAERYKAKRGTIEREYESRRPSEGKTDRRFTYDARGKPLPNPHAHASKRSLNSLNLRGLLVLVEPPAEVVPWSNGEAIRVIKDTRRSRELPAVRPMISDLRLLNALGGLDVDIDNRVPLNVDDVLDQIEARQPTEIALAHMNMWGTVHKKTNEPEPIEDPLSNGKPWWEDDDDQA